jgi:hypothetical protein
MKNSAWLLGCPVVRRCPSRRIEVESCYLVVGAAAWPGVAVHSDTANQRGGSEWVPIKILLEGDGNSNKMNTASNTRLRLTTQIGQAHVATGRRNQHTTFRPENAVEHQTSSLQTNTGQIGEHHRSDWSLLVRVGNFH